YMLFKSIYKNKYNLIIREQEHYRMIIIRKLLLILYYYFIINLTADRPCGHAVLMPNIHAGKPGRSKNPRLNLLYTHYSRPAACSNYLAPAVPTSLDLEPSSNLGEPHYMAAS